MCILILFSESSIGVENIFVVLKPLCVVGVSEILRASKTSGTDAQD